MGDDSEWMKLPTDQKCEHKVLIMFLFLEYQVFILLRLLYLSSISLSHTHYSFIYLFKSPGLESEVKWLLRGSATLPEDFR